VSVGIQLVGGPADGYEVVIPGDPMDPPACWEVFAASGNIWATAGQGQPPSAGVRELIYRREVNRSDDGPLWLYRYAEPTA
jgi:hypothetical protein